MLIEWFLDFASSQPRLLGTGTQLEVVLILFDAENPSVAPFQPQLEDVFRVEREVVPNGQTAVGGKR